MGVIFLEIPGFGLSNRIRTILAFWEIARRKNCHLYVYWLVNHMCDAQYDELFQPLSHTTFVKSYSEFKNLRKQHSHALYYKGQGQLHSILKAYGVKPSHELTKKLYGILQPVPEIWEEIQTFVQSHKLSECQGLHIRRTDHVHFIKRLRGTYTDDHHFEKIIKKHPQTTFYLSTDNAKTQENFQKQFPKQIITYQAVPNNKKPRRTTMDHAVIDIYLLGHCQKVHGSLGSSFSEFARELTRIWGKFK